MVKLLELENGVRRNKKNKLREYKSIGVDKFEDKTNQKIEVSNPYFMSRGWTKASEYFTLSSNEK